MEGTNLHRIKPASWAGSITPGDMSSSLAEPGYQNRMGPGGVLQVDSNKMCAWRKRWRVCATLFSVVFWEKPRGARTDRRAEGQLGALFWLGDWSRAVLGRSLRWDGKASAEGGVFFFQMALGRKISNPFFGCWMEGWMGGGRGPGGLTTKGCCSFFCSLTIVSYERI